MRKTGGGERGAEKGKRWEGREVREESGEEKESAGGKGRGDEREGKRLKCGEGESDFG